MKKLLVSALMICAATVVLAKETVTLVYPFSAGDTTAHYTRALVEEANKIQNQYTFVFDVRPGAGGTIAAKHVLATPNTVLATSTAFFVRPNFYPNESHDVSQFRSLMPQCAVPMVISSNKYRSWNEVPLDQPLNIGVSGLGATTHLVAMEVRQRFPLVEAVPYKSTNAATLDLAGQRIEMTVGFPGEVEQWIAQGRMYALGVTGTRSVNNIPTLESQGFRNLGQFVNGHHLTVPKSVSEKTFQTWRKIFVEAAKQPAVQKAYAVDHCQSLAMDLKSSETWFNNQVVFWRRMSQNVQINTK